MADTDEQQVETQAPAPGTPEYDAAMADKYRNRDQGADPYANAEGEPREHVKPEGVPDKFWNAETGQVDYDGLLKAHNELERKLGAGETVEGEQVAPEPDTAAADEQIQEVVTNAGLDTAALQTKILENGDIDAADYEALAKVGIPPELARQHVALLKGQADRHFEEVMDYGGGQEQVQAALDWASKNLTPEEIRGYNEMLAGPSWKSAIDTIQNKMGASSKTVDEPHLTTGGSAGVTGSVGYQHPEERQVDLQNPLYREMSPAGEQFRQEVFKKTRYAAWNKS